MIATDLEALREIFSDGDTHIAVGKIVKLSLADDRSVLFAQCTLLTQDRDVIAHVCWDSCGPNSGSFSFPLVGDMVVVEFAEGDEEQAYVTHRLSTTTDIIPVQAAAGHMVNRSLAGKKNYLLSDTKILLGQGGDASDPTEPLVLGTVMLAALTDLSTRLNAVIDAIVSGPVALTIAPGSLAPTAPALIASLNSIKSQVSSDLSKYVTTAGTNIVSKIAFTERGP
jgi:type VI secretion system (T6SS) baseplate-like injector VgrG